MENKEQILKILKLVEDGKLTPEEAEEIITAMKEAEASEAAAAETNEEYYDRLAAEVEANEAEYDRLADEAEKMKEQAKQAAEQARQRARGAQDLAGFIQERVQRGLSGLSGLGETISRTVQNAIKTSDGIHISTSS